jgi:hypothetical protein
MRKKEKGEGTGASRWQVAVGRRKIGTREGSVERLAVDEKGLSSTEVDDFERAKPFGFR